jgi:dihydrofolate reductase
LAEAASNSGNTLLFGRVTYQLMAGYWPSPEALKSDPIVATGMNSSPKIPFSRTLRKAEWSNTRLVSGTYLATFRAVAKQYPHKSAAVPPSGSAFESEGLRARAALHPSFQSDRAVGVTQPPRAAS